MFFLGRATVFAQGALCWFPWPLLVSKGRVIVHVMHSQKSNTHQIPNRMKQKSAKELVEQGLVSEYAVQSIVETECPS